MRVLMPLTDAFGGFGGIAQYNRDLLEALCSLPAIDAVEAIPRLAARSPGPLPAKLSFNTDGLGGARRFALAALRRGLFGPRPDIVICGHLHLLPLCVPIARARRARLILQIHGREAWQQPPRRFVARATAAVDQLLSVSHLTLDRYHEWARAGPCDDLVLPNTVHAERFGLAPRAPDLEAAFGLAGHQVIMTLGRLAASERNKGFDEIIDLMPSLLRRRPALKYLIAGAGDDHGRLHAKAHALGVEDAVIFTGLVPEARKADYFRLADAYVMPSHGEGFGIVLLEAMACGIPVIASRIDGGLEAIRDGMLGTAVDPNDPREIEAAILAALERPRAIPPGLAHFSADKFRARVALLIAGTA